MVLIYLNQRKKKLSLSEDLVISNLPGKTADGLFFYKTFPFEVIKKKKIPWKSKLQNALGTSLRYQVPKIFPLSLTLYILECQHNPADRSICDNLPTKATLFFVCCSEVNNIWLITYELANQCARKVLFTCVVYTNITYLELTYYF